MIYPSPCGTFSDTRWYYAVGQDERSSPGTSPEIVYPFLEAAGLARVFGAEERKSGAFSRSFNSAFIAQKYAKRRLRRRALHEQ